MSSPSGDYRAISTPRPPPISGHLDENTVPTFERRNANLLFTPSPGSGGRARRRTRREIYGSAPTRTTSRRSVGARERGVISMTEVPFFRLPNKNLSTAEKARFVKAVDDGLAQGISIAETTKWYGLNKNAYARYAKQIREGTADPKPGSGRPQKLSKEDKEVLMDINEEARGSLTFEEMAREFNKKCSLKISKATVFRTYHRDKWRSIRKRPCPKLTEDHMKERRLWAYHNRIEQHNRWGDDATVWIDIDEVSLPMFQFKGKRKLSPRDMKNGQGGHCGRVPMTVARRHVPSMMYLSAVANPNKKKKFDAKVGLWPFATLTKTKRKSKNRDAGLDDLEPIKSINHKVFADFIINKLVPAIQRKCPWAKEIVIQYDGATPHERGIKTAVEEGLEERERRIRWVKHPPQSPDTNLNDFCFFNSLKSALAKTKKDGWGFLRFDEQVQEVYRKWHSEDKLTNLWRLKSAVALKIVSHDGGNQFKMPHSKIPGVPSKPPTNGAVEEYEFFKEGEDSE
ncbi:hypothetical protein MICPUN_65029 [Micromonas commoda]|uniref:Transposase n=1 Tax=Micromonas commoda (strain RCC299 / NOUM17 / CCMP2709) TaxID=296587 RepID=C1EJQ8_MICCC|nr:hypothetical protein MICPUN_65029 [Micromonas commoda]ACO68268.1 hypothetical protein MICPUN_65029 [Micromonas commoda]|eukprot:XP_002507010.1 hypothetical protein MICPUN_65029 [Micromonas commoda]